MIVIKQHHIYRVDLKNNPRILYIFGDNLDRKGFGGQAKEMRGEPNAFGIATKRSISHNFPEDYFFDHQDDVFNIIDEEFKKLRYWITHNSEGESVRFDEREWEALVIPSDGIGTGLSRLPETAPKLLHYINLHLEELADL